MSQGDKLAVSGIQCGPTCRPTVFLSNVRVLDIGQLFYYQACPTGSSIIICHLYRNAT